MEIVDLFNELKQEIELVVEDERHKEIINALNDVSLRLEKLEILLTSPKRRKREPVLKHSRASNQKRPVMIVETGQVFESQTECAEAIGGSPSGVSAFLRGRIKQHKGFTFEYVN